MIVYDYFQKYILLLVVTSNILIVVKDQENRYSVSTNQRENERYLKWTLYVFIPNSIESKEKENSETNFAASSEPSGWDDWPSNLSIFLFFVCRVSCGNERFFICILIIKKKRKEEKRKTTITREF
jgi:hypothetical protein